MKKIVFACGGTLGHINPAIAVCDKIKEEYELYIITTNKELRNQTFKNSFINNIYYYDFYGFSRKKIYKNINIIKSNFKTYKQIKKELRNIKPDLVISMGGSCGTITSFAALKLNIKTIIHEQNKILGFGNKLVYKKVNKVLLSFPINNIKGVLVGNPVESVFYEKNKHNNLKEEVILIFGGSNGAYLLNDFFIDNYNKFNKYKIILLTGSKYYNENKEKINKINSSSFKIIEKTCDMLYYYNLAKVVIARGGATTLAEIMGLSKVSLIIPSPNVTSNHQYYNALHYKNKGCTYLIEEKELDVDKVLNIINFLTLEETQKKIKQNIACVHNIYSSYQFIDEIKKVLGEKDNVD